MIAIICDKCRKPMKKEEVGGKALIFKGFSWKGKRTCYKHKHYCKKCYEELFEK
jgi:hypothetical protein